MDDKTKKITVLNDAFRKSMRGGRVCKSSGIDALPPEEQAKIIAKVKLFDAFSEANDPYGEHDFGAFEHNGQDIFFKIDYYDPDMEHGSEDPSDPSRTIRVMTIMLAHEY